MAIASRVKNLFAAEEMRLTITTDQDAMIHYDSGVKQSPFLRLDQPLVGEDGVKVSRCCEGAGARRCYADRGLGRPSCTSTGGPPGTQA